MTEIYFDIETYSPHVKPRLNDKIISIAYKTEDSDIIVYKEWEQGEKKILEKFLNVVKESSYPNLIGHNIFRFDIPIIICRSYYNELGNPDDIYQVFDKAYSIDLIQCLLPSNRFYFKGLGLHNCAEKLGIEITGCPSSEIKTHYENENYDAIIHHTKEDIVCLEKLYNHLRNCTFNPFS